MPLLLPLRADPLVARSSRDRFGGRGGRACCIDANSDDGLMGGSPFVSEGKYALEEVLASADGGGRDCDGGDGHALDRLVAAECVDIVDIVDMLDIVDIVDIVDMVDAAVEVVQMLCVSNTLPGLLEKERLLANELNEGVLATLPGSKGNGGNGLERNLRPLFLEGGVPLAWAGCWAAWGRGGRLAWMLLFSSVEKDGSRVLLSAGFPAM